MKRWYKSKTLWYNIGAALVALSAELAPLIDILDPDRQAQLRAALIVALVVGNLILRMITETKVTR